jgi:DUF2892 family protein
MTFARFMSRWGRAPRIALGLALIAFGIYLQNPWGIAIAILGVIPLGSGLDNFCLAAPLFGGGVDGRRITKST